MQQSILSFAKKRSSNGSTSSSPSTLTDEQRARMEKNRIEACKRRRRAAIDLAELVTEPSWAEALKKEFDKSYFIKICEFLAQEKVRDWVLCFECVGSRSNSFFAGCRTHCLSTSGRHICCSESHTY